MNKFIVGSLLSALLAGTPAASAGAEGLTLELFEKLHKELSAAKEPWQQIPWHVSLLEARRQAAEEKKPIYMLCRAGHPLGCV